VIVAGVRDVAERAGAALRALRDDEAAPTAVEYGLMVAGVAAVIFVGVGALGQAVLQLFLGFTWP
jgi:Flp pilus assembly pilin Flp